MTINRFAGELSMDFNRRLFRGKFFEELKSILVLLSLWVTFTYCVFQDITSSRKIPLQYVQNVAPKQLSLSKCSSVTE